MVRIMSHVVLDDHAICIRRQYPQERFRVAANVLRTESEVISKQPPVNSICLLHT
jgi:hypothetical protein